ncbi:hypothetical protein N7448_009367 [Penicillium atrosanguineum]|uniref:Uncharacterized protein n=1 Tax=Penicillium atrosanguineum TaxID=1132637 RepID=A0A9W9Q3S3_9EURO|nr:uncharacterized protein N7443_006617 [Penicillium atrosanguineum]KAJ5123270.1 hypothetical protein N7448_009367 [Penicillium atrosanguineum]KAJ5141900.1 hypothetical protein N7526_002895 [Penicillium atrosanguineum]KAJ5298497.1 hypothetical protein N7443_006617 [Penicillium atrosanguineum]KAJ5321237.1 hypothetical protein N7476_004239 [Penicillium atrosanguineum]
MGIMGHHNLDPVVEPIALFEQFVAAVPQTIVLREKVLSVTGDSFDIKLANGETLLKVHGSWVSISGRKKVEDVHGKHLFDIVKEHLHIHSTYALEDTHRKKICEVKSSLRLIGSKAAATFTDRNGKAVTFTMKGGWFDHSADIVNDKTGQTVARIDRKLLSGRDLVFGQQTYAVVVAPGVDAALIAALCICFDEKNNEERGE